jgi:adenylyl-sulfate reductase (glutathione)
MLIALEGLSFDPPPLPACPQDQTAKECGLHSGNIVQSAEAQAAGEQADLWASGPVEALDHAALEKLADGQRDRDTLVVLYAPWCQYSQVPSFQPGCH